MNVTSVLRTGAAAAVLGLVFSACAGGPARLSAAHRTAPVLSADYVLAPVDDSTQFDLADLDSTDAAAQLRRAWILLQRHHPKEAIDAGASVLYGTSASSTTAEALARYIRAEAFDAMGESSRGDYDRERVLALALDPQLRARIAERTPAPRSAAVARQPEVTSDVAILPRSAWNPDAPIGSKLDPMGKCFRITVHHSAELFRDTSQATAAAELRVIQKSHMQAPDRRYGDIGYHYLIDPAGRIWEGRNLRWQGAHARSDNNKGNIGICVLGNFVRGRDGQRPTDRQLGSLRLLIESLCRRHGIAGNQIFCHSDFVATECPGAYLEGEVNRIAASLRGGGSKSQTAAAGH